MRIVLWALQSPINIGMILRTAEVYRVPVTIYDRHAVFEHRAARDTVSDFACGALERSPPSVWSDSRSARGSLHGRLIASSAAAEATPVHKIVLEETDCVLMRNEYDGLPSDVVSGCDEMIRIPMPPGFLPKPPSKDPIDPSRQTTVTNNGGPNLNVAVAASIVMFSANAHSFHDEGRSSPARLPHRC